MNELPKTDGFTREPTGDGVWWDGKELTNGSSVAEAVIQRQSPVREHNLGHEPFNNCPTHQKYPREEPETRI